MLPLTVEPPDNVQPGAARRDVAKTPHATPDRRWARGAATAVVLKGMAAVAALAVQLVLARCLGATAFGEYTLAISLLALAVLIVKAGWDQASQRFVPSYLATSDTQLLGAFRHVRNRAVLRQSILGMLLALVLWWLGSEALPPSLRTALAWAIALLPLAAFLDVLSADLRARGRLIWSEAPILIGRPLLLALAIVLLTGSSIYPVTTSTALTLWGVLSLVVLAALVLVDWQSLVATRAIDNVQPPVTEWWQTAIPMWWTAACSLWLQQADVILVGFLVDAEAAGVFSIAARISTTLTLGVVAINTVGAPLIAEQFTLRQRVEMQRTARRLAWSGTALTLLGLLGVVLLGPAILRLFGSDFHAAYGPLVILAIGQLLSSMTGSVNVLLAMTGQQQRVARVMSAFALLHLLLSIVLVPNYGVWGAAVASSVALLGWNGVLAWQVWQTLCIDPTILGRKHHSLATGGCDA